jgi:hypothetical protein
VSIERAYLRSGIESDRQSHALIILTPVPSP